MIVLVRSGVEDKPVSYALVEEGRCVSFTPMSNALPPHVGDIHIGRVIRRMSKAWFVDLGEKFGMDGYLPETEVVGSIVRGDKIIYQIVKAAMSDKSPRVTMRVSLAGRLLVYMPFQSGSKVRVSKDITCPDERNRLRSVVSSLSDGESFIARTESEGSSQEEIGCDVSLLTGLWGKIEEKSLNTDGSVLYEELSPLEAAIRDTPGITGVYCDSPRLHRKLRDFAASFSSTIEVYYISPVNSIYEKYKIADDIKEALSRKVNFWDGSYIYIEETEAMTVIDVNSGSYNGRGSKDDCAYAVNKAAVETIARQIKLRGIGGIVAIDFIDMSQLSYWEDIVSYLSSKFHRKYRARVSLSKEVGVVFITLRKSVGSISSSLTDVCNCCGGTGRVPSIDYVCSRMYDELKLFISELGHNRRLTIKASNTVIMRAIKMIRKIENKLRVKIYIQVDEEVSEGNSREFTIF
ncbi:MAG: hypothetical protein GY861_21280 [bacterium]|nr:hypothetical protein [bacterium]